MHSEGSDAGFSMSSSQSPLKTLQLPQWLHRKAIHKPSFVPETSKDECFFLIMAPRPEKFMRDNSLGKKVCKNISIFQWDNTSSHAEYHSTNYYLPLHMILKNLIPVWRSFSNLIFPFCLLNTLFGVSWKIQKWHTLLDSQGCEIQIWKVYF